jgi:cytochrome c-type biogenesis protein CcmE
VNRTKRRATIAIGLCVVALIAIIGLGVALSGNIVYYRNVSEALKSRTSQGDKQFRLAGAVVPGSAQETKGGVDFEISDGKKSVQIVHIGDPPSLFKDKIPVVCEGHWSRDGTFASDRIMIRHGSEYKPPKVKFKS